MSDFTESEELKAHVASSLPLIATAVRYAFRRYSYVAQADEVEELAGQIVLFLLEEDCRMMHQYISERAKFSTWLYYVALNHVGPYLRRQGIFTSLEAFTTDHFHFRATQEEIVLRREERRVMRKVFEKLTIREQTLLRLSMKGIGDELIAGLMSIKAQTVRQQRYQVKKKLQRLVTETVLGRSQKW